MKVGTIRQWGLLVITLSLSNLAYSAPSDPELLSPVGIIDNPTPEFVWRDQSDVNRFRLYVLDRSIQTQVHLQYYNRSDICDGALCRVTPDIILGVSEKHKWSVKAYNDDGGSRWVREYFTNVGTPPPPELELTDLNLIWAGYPLIADDVGNRLFVSLGDAYSSSTTISGTISYTNLPAGYSLRIDGSDIISGNQLTSSVQHGDKLPVSVYNNNQLIKSYDLVVTNLPLFEVWAAAIVDEPKLPGAWRWADGQAGIDTGVQNLGIEYRGGTSQEFDKKSFGFETRELEFPDESDNVRFFDLRNDDDWIADAAYRDLAIVRNLVSHDIYRDMRDFAYIDTDGVAKGQSTIAGGVAEMILNGEYHGLYVISERIDRKLLDLAKIDVPEDEAGNELWDQVDFTNPDNGTLLYKADTNNAGFYNPESVNSDFELKYPDPDDLVRFDPLIDLVNFVNYSDNATFAAEIGDRVDLESLADFWILRLVTSNRDTFKKNYYIGRNKSQKWFFVPWDFDATFGLRWSGAQDSYSTRYINPGTHQITGRLVELGVTSFTTLVKNRWQALRSDLLTPSAITNRFAGYFDLMGVDQTGLTESARNRNLQRWPGSGNLSSGQFEVGEAAYIEQWLTDRLENVDTYIDNLPGAAQ